MQVNKDYQFLILDIDGTLLNSQNELTKATYDRLMQLMADGYQLVLASGRPTASMLETARQLKLDQAKSYIISYNGAEITDMATQEVIYQKGLDDEDLKTIIAFNEAQGLSTIAYGPAEIIIDRPNDHSEVEAFLTKLPYRYDAAYFEKIPPGQLKFIGVGAEERVEAANSILNGHIGQATTAITSLPFYLEYFHHQVSKGNAIKALVESLGYSVDQVVACGDGNNDASMIQAAGLGVAMANATDYLKSLAQEITLSNDEDGLIPIMDKYFPSSKD